MKRSLTAVVLAATLLFSYNLKAMDYKLISVVNEIKSNRWIVKEEVIVSIDTYEIKVEPQSKSKKIEDKDLPESLTDVFTDEECEILYRIVEAEATGASVESKQNVANVIFNRVESDDFPNTIKEVVFEYHTNKNGKKIYQFSPIPDGRYYSVKVTKDTKKACKKAYEEKDTADGALYFDIGVNSWASRNKTYLFTDDTGHRFYK